MAKNFYVCRHTNLLHPKQVPGVEADDVIGTLAKRSVDAGFKVISLAINAEIDGIW